MRLLVLSLLVVTTVCGFAQDDTVVIEATRFREDVRRLPASVSVITQEDIARSPARTVPELLNEQVGFTMKDLYGNNAAVTSMDLRGFGVTGPQNTLILLDGRRLNDFDLSGVQWSALPVASIERIEIVRGMGAVLYGDAAAAGLVNIVTRSPLRQGRSLQLLGRVASDDTVEAQAYASASAGDVGINGVIHKFASDGYRQNNRNEQENAALNLRWALGEGALDLRFGVDRQDLRLPGGRFVQPSIGLDQTTDPRGTNTPLDYASRDGARAGVGFMQRFGAAELSVGLDRREKDQRSFFDFGGFPSYRADDLELTSLTPRIRLPVANHTLIAGVDWHNWRYHSRRTDRPENLAQPANRASVTQDTEGVYLHDSIRLAPATLAAIGWRSERARYSGDDAGAFAAPSVRETQKQRAWELGLRQRFGERWTGFGRLGRSFRFVNAEEIYESDPFFAPQFQLLRPQHAKTAEIGVEWQRSAHRWRTALFRTDVRDEIHLDPFTTGVGNTNLPPSRRQGLELDAVFALTKSLRLAAGYAYTEARFLEGTLAGSPSAIGTGLPLAGRTVPLVPRHKVNLALSWEVRSSTRVSAALTAASEQVLDNDEPNTLAHRIAAFKVLDLRLSETIGSATLSVALNNVLDEDYYQYAARSAFTPDRYTVYPLPGRTLSLTAQIALR